jgi:hypothetical protein
MPLNKSWHDYNESLIERGRVLIDVSFLKSSNKEIKEMNIGKVGAPFQYSDSYVQFLAFLKIGFKIPYRMLQDIVRGLSQYVRILEEIHFTHIRRRMIKIKPSIGNDNDNDNEEPITLVVDASGLTVSKKGDYIEEKWIRKKEFIKLHIAADAKSKKVVSFRITRGNVHDTKKFCPLVREASRKCNIDRVYADKAHDNRRNFNLLDRLDIEPVIMVRNNASTRARGCQLRREEVILKKLWYQRWKQIKDAGRRWIAEIVFSSIKRALGEDLFSKRFSAQKVEGGLKIMLYNKFISL